MAKNNLKNKRRYVERTDVPYCEKSDVQSIKMSDTTHGAGHSLYHFSSIEFSGGIR